MIALPSIHGTAVVTSWAFVTTELFVKHHEFEWLRCIFCPAVRCRSITNVVPFMDIGYCSIIPFITGSINHTIHSANRQLQTPQCQ